MIGDKKQNKFSNVRLPLSHRSDLHSTSAARVSKKFRLKNMFRKKFSSKKKISASEISFSSFFGRFWRS